MSIFQGCVWNPKRQACGVLRRLPLWVPTKIMPEPSIPRNTSGFHVFSIRPKAAANSTDEITDPYTIRLYKHRQSHRKSRLGCAACKAKRVKVRTPACLLCHPCGGLTYRKCVRLI